MENLGKEPRHQHKPLLAQDLEHAVIQGHDGLDVNSHERDHQRCELPRMLIHRSDAALVDDDERLVCHLPPTIDVLARRSPSGGLDVHVPQVFGLLSRLCKESAHGVRNAVKGLEDEDDLPHAGETGVRDETGAIPTLVPTSQHAGPPLPKLMQGNRDGFDGRLQRLHLQGPSSRKVLELGSISKQFRTGHRQQGLLPLEPGENLLQRPQRDVPLLQEQVLVVRRVHQLPEERRPPTRELVPSHRSDQNDELLPHPRVLLREKHAEQALLQSILLRVIYPIPLPLLRKSPPEGARGGPIPGATHEVLRHDGRVQPQTHGVHSLERLGLNDFQQRGEDATAVVPLPVLQSS
mmetsp:Transcript_13381/g.37574  ORF Transcript_13381/g.37574 Transcript_13381/m.37574 type:complete len:350 (+) Transcript_13381:2205-3254(+)